MDSIVDRLRTSLRSSLELARQWESEAEAARKARHIEVAGDQNDEALIGHACDGHAARVCMTAIYREWTALGGKE